MSRGTAVGERTHPLHRFSGRVHQVLDALGDPALWSLTEAETTETLTELHAAVGRVQGHLLGLVGHADGTDLAASTGQVNTAALVRSLTRMAAPEANRSVKTARLLHQLPATAHALLTGGVNLAQAVEILTAVAALPDSVSPLEREKAERHLLDLADSHDAQELRRLGRHLLDVIDPDGADQRLADQLERDERPAARKAFLSLADNGDGTHDLRGRVSTLHRAMLERYLAALLNLNRPDPIDRDGRSIDELRGEAFGQLLERIPAKGLPKLGGINPTVVVTMELETLMGGLKAASLDTGELISAGQARRLACAAGVIPAVLGSKSEVLDWGRKVRLHKTPQRLAMGLQQGGTCAVEGCTRPAACCDAHHLIAWGDLGDTSVKDGALICPRHHTLAHQPRFRLQRVRPGRVRLVRRH